MRSVLALVVVVGFVGAGTAQPPAGWRVGEIYIERLGARPLSVARTRLPRRFLASDGHFGDTDRSWRFRRPVPAGAPLARQIVMRLQSSTPD